jgi:hypothetical protein
MLHEAREFLVQTQYWLNCIVAVNRIASLSAQEYFMRRIALSRIAQHGDEQTERVFYLCGINGRDYCAEHAEVSQDQWKELLGVLFTSLVAYGMMYSKYWPPVNIVEGTFEMAARNLSGTAMH